MADVPSRIGVVGAGTMGAGIAQLGALAGIETVLHDPVAEALEKGATGVHANLDKGTERGRWSADDAAIAHGRLTTAASLDGLSGCELVIEAAPERLDLKRELFERLSEICDPGTVLATNTSSIPVTQIASAAAEPENVLGLHFFNPAPLMKLVEVIAALQTGERALAIARATGEAMGKRVIDAGDGPGFLVNRCGRPFSSEALRLLQEGLATHERIDWIYRVGGGYRMGPFELMDLVGIDVGFAVAKSFMELSFGEPRWKPNPLQARMAASGRLGRKTGRGWYDYSGDGPYRPDDDPDASLDDRDAQLLHRVQSCIVNEAAFALGEGVGSAEDIDAGVKLGLNWPKGSIELGRELGFDRVLAEIDRLYDFYREDRYRAAPLLRSGALS
ncbi:MAG: 3-hydroxyacyl-CoA dehydrogenase NAD-binding domain-containing protein [Thermoleophilaceae bacterium]